MRFGFLFSALFSILILSMTAGDVFAQSRNFNEPHVRGVRLDYCKHQGGQACGKPAADLFCKEMNYSRSIGHKIDRKTGEQLGRTLIFGDGALCTGYTCRAFASILCLRDEVVKTPVPKKPEPPKKPKPAPEKKAEKKPAPKKPAKPNKKKKPETAKVKPKYPSLPKSVAVPTPRPKAETAELQDDFVIIPMKLRRALPAGASLTRCILNHKDCPHPVTSNTEVKPEGVNKLKRFQWDISKVPDAKVAVWQISTKPFPTFSDSEEDTSFDGLIKWSVAADPKDNRGTLEIDFGEVEKEAGLQTQPESFYVRIIPFSGLVNGRAAGLPSNVIRVFYAGEDPSPPEFDWDVFSQTIEDETPKPLFDVRIKSYTPLILEQYKKWGCVVVVEHPKEWDLPGPFGEQSNQWKKDYYKIGAEICPPPYRGPGSGKITSFEDFIEFVFDAWDWAGDRYDDLVDIAVEVVLYATPMGRECKLYTSLAEEVGIENAQSVCRTGSRVAVNAGMVALGVPPSLPSYNELLDKGVDYAVELAIEKFEAETGVPCVSICEDAFRVGLEKLADELKRKPDRTACVSAKEAHKHGKEPRCFPPGLLVKPAPGSKYVPPIAEIEITRRKDVELPWGVKHPECYASAYMKFDNIFPGGVVYGKTTQQHVDVKKQSISGELFKGKSRELKLNIPQGETVSVTMVFDEPLKHQFPWTKKLWQTSQVIQRDELGAFGPNWFQLYFGSQMTLIASSNCTDDVAQLQMTMPDGYRY